MFTAFAEFWGESIADMYNISPNMESKAIDLFLDHKKIAYCGHYAFGINHWFDRPVYYASVMREPTSRMASLYNFCLPVLQSAQKIISQKNVNFSSLKIPNFHYDFANWVEKDSTPEGFFNSTSAELDNGMVRRFSGYGINPQKCTKEALTQAKKNIEKNFAVVGVLERYEETLELFSNKFNLPAISHNKVNITKKIQLPKSEFSKELLSKIERQNELDIELYQWVDAKLNTWIDVAQSKKPPIVAPNKKLMISSPPLWKAVGQSPLREAAMKNKGVKVMNEKKDEVKAKKVIICKKIKQVGYNDKGLLLGLNVVIARANQKLPEESVSMGMSLANARLLYKALGAALQKQKEATAKSA